MEGLTSDVRMLPLLAATGVFDTEPFVLIDVGCSGGIDATWRRFGRSLVAHGFDPCRSECRRLQDREEWPGVKYHPRLVGLPAGDEFARRRYESYHFASEHYQRTSCAWAQAIVRPRGIVVYTPSDKADFADESTLVAVADFVSTEGLRTVDFIKVDTDGSDIDILVSCRDLFNSHQVLGVGVEINWVGTADECANTFTNVDRLLRGFGFSLFGITNRPYSRRDMPGTFVLGSAGQTDFGQPLQGDAIYLRDLASPLHRALAGEYSTAKLAKLASLFEICRLPDCAAELINTFKERFATVANTDHLLNALTPPLGGQQLGYAQYVAAFADDFRRFYVGPSETEKLTAQYAQQKRELEAVKWQFERLRREHEILKKEYRSVEEYIVSLRKSRSWRVATLAQRMARSLGLSKAQSHSVV